MRVRTIGLAAGALVATSAVVLASVTSVEPTSRAGSSGNELGPEAERGSLYYVAVGDSFTSGEGDPYVNPITLAERFDVESLDDLSACPLVAGDVRTPACGPDPDWAENDLGWLGNTGTDVEKIGGFKGELANRYDSKSFGGNNCHRSEHAYPVRVWRELERRDPRWATAFAACSGATSNRYRSDFNGEPPQLNALIDQPADVVTIGFGGNDAGFGDLVSCGLVEANVDRIATLSPNFASDEFTEIDGCRVGLGAGLDKKLSTLRADLGGILDDLQDKGRLAKDGRVIAVGYPRVFPDRPPDSCGLGTGTTIGQDSMVWLNDVADRINSTIREVATAKNASFVDTTDVLNIPDESGVRHDFCVDDGSQRWINRFIPSDLQRSMHPKFQYHEVVAQRVIACVDDAASCDPSATLDRWVASTDRKCIQNPVPWYPDSDIATKREGMAQYEQWAQNIQPPPAIPGGLVSINLRISFYTAARRVIDAQLDPNASEVEIVRLQAERDRVLGEARVEQERYPEANSALSRLSPACS